MHYTPEGYVVRLLLAAVPLARHNVTNSLLMTELPRGLVIIFTYVRP